MSELKNRRDFYKNKIEAALKETTNPDFEAKTIGDINDLMEILTGNWKNFEDKHIDYVSKLTDEAEQLTETAVDNEVEKKFLATKKAYRERIEKLTPVPQPNIQQTERQQFAVTVKPPDSLSNIVNTWGTFDGSKYREFSSFLERFMAGTKDLAPVNRLHLLQSAVKGEAASRMGKLTLSQENFQISVDRLKKTYEVKYLTVQDLIRTMTNIPKMVIPSRAAFREIIDTTDACLTQLKAYIKVDNWDTWIVFTTIDRLDSSTRKEWESFRKNLAKQQAKSQASSAESTRIDGISMDDSQSPDISQLANDYIPTWNDLETFLEEQAGVLMHSENDAIAAVRAMAQRNEGSSRDSSANRSGRDTKPKYKSRGREDNKRLPTGYELCKICGEDHSIVRCPKWRAWDLKERRDHVIRQNLCYRCLKASHGDGRCAIDAMNNECKKCSTGNAKKYHNSYLCPTRELDRKSEATYLNEEEAKPKKQ